MSESAPKKILPTAGPADGDRRAFVVMDNAELGGRRSLYDLTTAAGFIATRTVNTESFIKTLNDLPNAMGILAFEQILSDPVKRLHDIRAKIPSSVRLVIVHGEENRQLKLGARLLERSDFFIQRSESPFEFMNTLRQAQYDAYIEKRIQNSLKAPDIAADIRDLLSWGARMLGCRTHDEVWRTLALHVGRVLDVAFVMVLHIDDDASKLQVIPFASVDHQVYWQAEQDILRVIQPFSFKPLAPPAVHYDNAYIGPKPVDRNVAGNEMVLALPVPLVINGRLVGCLGMAVYATGKDMDQRIESAIVPLSSYLCSSLANISLLSEIGTKTVIDELTGAYNRRYLKTAIDGELERAQRQQTAFAIVMLDIDAFKKINDVYGHQQGDVVLREFVEFLKGELRNVDQLIRYDGEEFVILLNGVDSARAMLAMERIRVKDMTDQLPSVKAAGTLSLSFSAGIADYPGCGLELSADDLLKLASASLANAKKEGGNQIRISNLPVEDGKGQAGSRKFPRFECQIPVQIAELAHFSNRVTNSMSLNISSGGLAIRDDEKRLTKNKHVLVYLSGQPDPMLCRVAWVRSQGADERLAGLEFVRNTPGKLGEEPATRPKRALIVSESEEVVERASRILMAAHFEVNVWKNDVPVDKDILHDFALLLIGESSFRKDIGIKLQKMRENDEIGAKIIFINEDGDRQRAIEEIQTAKIEHLVPNDEMAMEALFAGINKLLLGEIFGIKKYLMWGADSKQWIVTNGPTKERALSGVHKYALGVKCHPRIADLLIMGVDEMLINAIHSNRYGRNSPVAIECGSDGRLLTVSVLDENGALNIQDIYKSLGRAIETAKSGPQADAKSAAMGFQIMLTTMNQLSVNVSPGKCTEVIGIIDLRKSLKEYRSAVPAFDLFTVKK